MAFDSPRAGHRRLVRRRHVDFRRTGSAQCP